MLPMRRRAVDCPSYCPGFRTLVIISRYREEVVVATLVV